MKICYIAPDVAVPHVRGASTHVFELSKNLVLLGNDVYLISRRLSEYQKKYEELQGIKVYRMYRGIFFTPPFSGYSQLSQRRENRPLNLIYQLYLFTIHALYIGIIAANIIRHNKIDAVIERETSFGAGAIASVLTNRPLVLEVIGPRCSMLSIRRANKILAYTKEMISSDTAKDKLILTTAAVDTELFKPDDKQRKEIRERYDLGYFRVVGYVGIFASWHGVEDLVYASKDLVKKYNDLRFLMVGPYYEETKNLTKVLGIQDFYIFTGSVDYKHVPKFINACDILVAPYNPTRSELRRRYGIGSPLKVFEYMACEKPLITTSVKPITDVVEDRINGILIPPGDIQTLKEALIELMDNTRFAKSMGMKARECAVERYSWKGVAKSVESVISGTMK